MAFFKNISPRSAFGDIVDILREKQDYKALFFAAASVPPILLVTMFYLDAERLNKPPPPTIFYVKSWSLDRSYEDIVVERAERLRLREALLEERRQKYKVLGRASGIDVDKIDAETEAARAKVARERAAFERGILERAAERQKELQAQNEELHKRLYAAPDDQNTTNNIGSTSNSDQQE